MNQQKMERYFLPFMAMLLFFGPAVVSAVGTANLLEGNMRGLVMFGLPAMLAWFAWEEVSLWGFDGARKIQLFSWICGIALGGFGWLLADALRTTFWG